MSATYKTASDEPEIASIATPPNQPRSPTGPGVGLAYDVATAKLADQHEYVGRLNTRLGGVLAVLLATGAAVVAITSVPIRLVAVGLLVASLVEVARATRVAYWNDAPDPHKFQMYAGDQPDYMKEIALSAVLKAFDYNQPRITEKGKRLNWAITFVVLAIVLLVVARAVNA